MSQYALLRVEFLFICLVLLKGAVHQLRDQGGGGGSRNFENGHGWSRGIYKWSGRRGGGLGILKMVTEGEGGPRFFCGHVVYGRRLTHLCTHVEATCSFL